jgi:tetratricopeptide (TPR) repeat protein/ubiquinone/menaquinone biosynthesis C-methylase UbiE
MVSNGNTKQNNDLIKLKELYSSHRYDAVISYCRRCITLGKKSAKIYNILGAAYYATGQNKKAIQSYKNAIRQDHTFHETYNNIAITLISEKNPKAAIKYLNAVLQFHEKFPEAHNTLGNALKQCGDLVAAKNSYLNAIQLRLNYAEAYNNLGNLHISENETELAIIAYRDAIKFKSNYIDPLYNLGKTYNSLTDQETAVEYFQQALKIDPNNYLVWHGISQAYKNKGEYEKAIQCLIKSITIQPSHKPALWELSLILKNVSFTEYLPSISQVTLLMLKEKSSVRPKDIVKVTIEQALLREPILTQIACMDIEELEPSDFYKVIDIIMSDGSLHKLLKLTPFTNIIMEDLLIIMRKTVLLSLNTLSTTSKLIEFLSSVAQQCFINEYIYPITKDEQKCLAELEKYVERVISDGGSIDHKAILCYASYKPLVTLRNYNLLVKSELISEVFDQQIEQPKQEKILTKKIPHISIRSGVSELVKNQYENNPYPKWVSLALPDTSLNPQEIFKDLWIDCDNFSKINTDSLKILVAGCGTGQHAIQTAKRFLNSQVTAVDLSLSSLAYAKRKTIEHDINNINYLAGDILSISEVNQEFDIVECIGVLHHMEEPRIGLKALHEVLKPGGFLKLGLYSSLARKQITDFRKKYNSGQINFSVNELKKLREMIKRNTNSVYDVISKSRDFYDTSSARDLLFHVQEHTFQILEIEELLTEFQLKFLGFENKQIVSEFRKTNNNYCNLQNLAKWDAFEKNYPNAFGGMYQFWCQKL